MIFFNFMLQIVTLLLQNRFVTFSSAAIHYRNEFYGIYRLLFSALLLFL